MLQAGGAGLLGLSLSKVWAAEAARQSSGQGRRSAATEAPGQKRHLFVPVWRPEPIETFDLKPDVPAKIRGPFKPIASRTPGLLISEHLPRLSAASDKLCVIRTITHPYNDHSSAGHYIQTGHPWHVPIGGGFNATEKDWPAMGSIVEHVRPARARRQRTRYPQLRLCAELPGASADVQHEARQARAIRGLAGTRLPLRWRPISASATTRTTLTSAIARTKSLIFASRGWPPMRACQSID